jgi:hypothetical protein
MSLNENIRVIRQTDAVGAKVVATATNNAQISNKATAKRIVQLPRKASPIQAGGNKATRNLSKNCLMLNVWQSFAMLKYQTEN